MPSYRHPGVYVQEAGVGPPPIAGASTDVAAFVDVFADGPLNTPVQIKGTKDFESRFGATCLSPASLAIHDFFANGGRSAWVVRIPGAATGSHELHGGLQALAGMDGVFNVLCLPCAAELADAALRAAYRAALNICAARRAFLIIDIPAAVLSPAAMLDWLEQHADLRHANAAVYFPRLIAAATSLHRGLRTRAASGAVAGLYARTDAARGVWKAPAGTEADLRGVQLAAAMNDAANDLLNPQGINVLRAIDGRPACWGARTLSPDPEWKYVPVRRLALFIESSLERGLAWAAFEPNGEPLWTKVRRTIENFMAGLFRAGAFIGASPDQAYFVRADRSTMTQDDIASGRLNILVGFAPLMPAEFSVLRISINICG